MRHSLYTNDYRDPGSSIATTARSPKCCCELYFYAILSIIVGVEGIARNWVNRFDSDDLLDFLGTPAANASLPPIFQGIHHTAAYNATTMRESLEVR